jgi:hypothetical protein
MKAPRLPHTHQNANRCREKQERFSNTHNLGPNSGIEALV